MFIRSSFCPFHHPVCPYVNHVTSYVTSLSCPGAQKKSIHVVPFLIHHTVSALQSSPFFSTSSHILTSIHYSVKYYSTAPSTFLLNYSTTTRSSAQRASRRRPYSFLHLFIHFSGVSGSSGLFCVFACSPFRPPPSM